MFALAPARAFYVYITRLLITEQNFFSTSGESCSHAAVIKEPSPKENIWNLPKVNVSQLLLKLLNYRTVSTETRRERKISDRLYSIIKRWWLIFVSKSTHSIVVRFWKNRKKSTHMCAIRFFPLHQSSVFVRFQFNLSERHKNISALASHLEYHRVMNGIFEDA